MIHEKGMVERQGPSIADLEKDLNYYKVELEVVEMKRAEAVSYSLKMAVLVVAALGIMVLDDHTLMKKEELHVPGIMILVFCFAAVGFGALMLIQRVPLIFSQRHVDTGVMMNPADLRRDYGTIIREKEKLLADALAQEEQIALNAEARKIEFEAELQAAGTEFGFGKNIQLGDESGISEDDAFGLTISLEDALSEIGSFEEEEEETTQ